MTERFEFPEGEELQVATADLCYDYGHDKCPGMEANRYDPEAGPVFCICFCHQDVKTVQ